MKLALPVGLVLLSLLSSATAQGLWLGPDPAPIAPLPHPPERPLPPHVAAIRVTELRVRTEIDGGVATTELRQVFRNDGERVGEGTWILPLPPGAVADQLAMIAGGVTMTAEVLDAGKARGIYEDIVRRQRDPALLEYFGTGCLRARVFPIPARGELPVVVRYRQVLDATGGLYEWRYPLRAASAGGQAPESTSVEVVIRDRTPIKSVYSPLAGVLVQRRGEHEARASFELRGQLPQRDFSIFYGLSSDDLGIHLLTYRKGGEPGCFLMLLSPRQEWPEPEHTRKVVTFVLDTSGSMQGEKIAQARGALRYFLESLRPRDLFDVIPFATEARPFFGAPVPADRAHLEQAFAKVDELEARGGTNIEDALRAALTPELPAASGDALLPITVFLTDGCPTVGTTEVDPLLALAAQHNRQRARVFVFGVGDDVNTRLLDRIAEDSRGDRHYVRPGESIEVKTGALFEKLSHPVMTQIELSCEGIDGFDLFPRRTPDLFKGGRLLVVGRYRGAGTHEIELRGMVDGKVRTYRFSGTFPERSTVHDFVPALWAERKVAFLLEQVRLHGPQQELTDEIKRLGVEFGIVTPFTSHLIVEEGMRIARIRGVDPGAGRAPWLGGAEDAERVRRELGYAGVFADGAAAPEVQSALERAADQAEASRDELKSLHEQETGANAVEDSAFLGAMAQARAPAQPGFAKGGDAAQLLHRRIAGRSFYLAGGVWVDARFRADMQPRVREVQAYSDGWFALLEAHPELAPMFAFSTRLVVVLGDVVVEVR
jgi:Ca-activated chloride channel family protein